MILIDLRLVIEAQFLARDRAFHLAEESQLVGVVVVGIGRVTHVSGGVMFGLIHRDIGPSKQFADLERLVAYGNSDAGVDLNRHRTHRHRLAQGFENRAGETLGVVDALQ